MKTVSPMIQQLETGSQNQQVSVPPLPFWRRLGPRWKISPWWSFERLDVQQYSLLRVLKAANENRLPLVPLLAAFAEEHRGTRRWRLRRFVNRLAKSNSLITELERMPEILSDEMVLAIRFGIQSGTLSQAYEDLLTSEKPMVDRRWSLWQQNKVYWILLVAVLVFVVSIVSPVYRDYLSVDEGPVHASTRALLSAYSIVQHRPWVVVISFVALVWLFNSAAVSRLIRKQLERSGLSNYDARTSTLFRLLSNALTVGRPLSGSLSTLAKYHFDPMTRRQLLMVRNEVEQGENAWVALQHAGLLTLAEQQALATSPSNNMRVWTLRRLSETKKRKLHESRMLRIRLWSLLILLGISAAVLWVCYSYFSLITTSVHHFS